MIIRCEQEGLRVDVFLSEQVETLSRSGAGQLAEKGKILVGGKPVKKNYKTHAGDEISFALPEPEPVELLPENIPLDIRYEDEDVIVINKPKGLVVHPAPGHWSGTLVNALMYHCRDSLSGINGELRPGIVDRYGYQRPADRGKKRFCPSGIGRAAEGSLPFPGLRGGRSGRYAVGFRHH